jgi:hypothetical protein
MCGSPKSPEVCSSVITARSSKVVRIIRRLVLEVNQGGEQHSGVALYRDFFGFVPGEHV